MADKLAEHAGMNSHDETSTGENHPPLLPRMDGSRRILLGVGAGIAALITALAFGAYRQPELLLNLMGLRYCG